MNYRKAYLHIIFKAKSENRKKLKKDNPNYIYYEAHHILPKSIFPLWTKRKSNIVLLTAREHFFCHQLLEKIYPNSNMFLALWRLATDKQNKVCSSREYQRIKERYHLSESHKENLRKASHILWASDKADEVREKIKAARAAQKNLAWGKRSLESKKNISEGTKKAMSDPEIRKKISERTKQAMNRKDIKEALKKSGQKAGALSRERAKKI